MIDLYNYTWQDRHNAVYMAIELARLVLPIFEDRYLDDSRPRKAIEAAEACLRNPSARTAADAAAAAGYDAIAAAHDTARARDAYPVVDVSAAYTAGHAARAAYVAYIYTDGTYIRYAAHAAVDAVNAAARNYHKIDRIVVKWIAIDLGVDLDTERGKAVQVALLANRLDYARAIAVTRRESARRHSS